MAVTLLGAASYMHSNGGVPAEVMNHVPHMSEEYAVALRDGLLKIGLAGGLMRAGAEMAAKVHEGGHGGNGEGEGEDADADADADTDNGADAHTEDEDEDGGAEGGNDGEGNSQSNAAQGMVAAGVAAQMRETAEQMARMLQSHFPRMHQPAEDAAAQQQQQRAHGGENNESASTAHYAAGVNRSNMAFPSSIAAKLYRAFASSHGQEGEEARHDEDGSGGNNSSEANHSSAAETSDSNDTSPSSLLAPRWRRRHRGQRSHYRPRDGGLSASDASNGGADLVSSAADDASSDEAAPRSAAAEPSPTEVRAMECPVGPDPYGHDVILEGDEGSGADSEDSGTDFRGGSSPDRKQRGLSSSPSSASAAGSDGGGKNPHRKKPSGCVGAYVKSVRAARDEVTSLVKARRKAAFEALPEDERNRISTVFVDACASDATLPVVRELVQLRGVVDVDGFYVGSDGSVTCGLHAAAFHGAAKVVRFLTSPPDLGREGEAPAWPRDNGAPAAGTAPTSSPTYQDGGACNVDLRDANGWTAAHFAAGADTVHVLRVLAERGAELSAEASNGYTPYHWAERLGNIESAAVLREAGADSRFLEVRWMFGGGGGGAAPDFLPAFLANRMRGLVPTGH
uniref:Uncharacterized protein n=1 Tax=Odontella aurita TaxID=265563 RepID=A0A7S4IYU9_9STRA